MTVTLKRHLMLDARRIFKAANVSRSDTCESCGHDRDIHAHHDDYAQPLAVRWLCRSCHIKLHMARGEWRPQGMLPKRFRAIADGKDIFITPKAKRARAA